MRSALIRPARPADSDAIARVHIATWRDAYAGILPDSYLVHRLAREAHREQWRMGRDGSRAGTLVAELDGVVGFATYGGARHARERALGEIHALYVDPDAQGQGLGRALLTESLRRQYSAGCSAVDVEVLAANPSRHFYSAMGAAVIGQGTHNFAGRQLAVVFYRWVGQGAIH